MDVSCQLHMLPVLLDRSHSWRRLCRYEFRAQELAFSIIYWQFQKPSSWLLVSKPRNHIIFLTFQPKDLGLIPSCSMWSLWCINQTCCRILFKFSCLFCCPPPIMISISDTELSVLCACFIRSIFIIWQNVINHLFSSVALLHSSWSWLLYSAFYLMHVD
jgi:hypothetical protein